MNEPVKKGLPVVGVIFLAVAAFKFLQGDGWVVWLILGVLFGGLGIFGLKKSRSNQR